MCVYFDSVWPAQSATDEPVQWRFRAEIAHGRTELGGCTYLVVFVVKCYSMRAGLHGDMVAATADNSTKNISMENMDQGR